MRNAATALQVLGKYRTLIKKPNEDVISYYTRVLAIVSELHEAGERICEADLVATILNGLPQDFHLVRTAININGECQLWIAKVPLWLMRSTTYQCTNNANKINKRKQYRRKLRLE